MKNVRRWSISLLVLCLLSGMAGAEAPHADVGDWLTAMTDLVVQTGNRESFDPNEQLAAHYLKKTWEAQGYRQEDRTLIDQNIPSPWELAYQTGWDLGVTNLIAVQRAVHSDPAVVIVCAHYDSFYGTVGAKDNASGVAAVLTLSEAFAAAPPYPNTELRFIAFGGEEYGSVGSVGYVESLTAEERARVLAVLNIDILAVEEGAANVALCCNTLGGRDANGAYRQGSDERAASNRASLAVEKAFRDLGGFSEGQRGVDFCIPHHWGDGDHVPFHNACIDAATVCFQGNAAIGWAWPDDMHTPDDDLDKRFDLQRTQHALTVLCRAIDGLATERGYGGEAKEE